eukprot:scaffold58441_cov57-Phaeocystis_antarctica.AAC.1
MLALRRTSCQAALTRTLHRCAAALRCDSTTRTAAATAAHCAPSRSRTHLVAPLHRTSFKDERQAAANQLY